MVIDGGQIGETKGDDGNFEVEGAGGVMSVIKCPACGKILSGLRCSCGWNRFTSGGVLKGFDWMIEPSKDMIGNIMVRNKWVRVPFGVMVTGEWEELGS